MKAIRFISKYFYLCALFIVSVPLLLLIWHFSSAGKEMTFTLVLGENTEYCICSYTADDTVYLFLPGNVSTENVLSRSKLRIDGKEYNAGDPLSGVSVNDRHEIVNGKKKSAFVILKGSDVAVLYINTATGSMKEVYADKDHKEPVSVIAYDSSGAQERVCSARIKGRGNTTWDWGKKRPFTLIFDEEISFLGLTKASRFVLLANAADITNTKNKSAFLLSEKLGLEWTPSAEYAELYINGEYLGLYLVCDRVENSAEKLALNEATDYLLHATYRKEKDDTILHSGAGHPFAVRAGVTEEPQLSGALSLLNDVEEKLFAGAVPEQLDTDSYIKKYFLEQIVCNTDVQSYYFYIKSGKFYAGPAWDYDLAAQRNCVETVYAYRRFSWYNKIFENDELVRLMVAEYPGIRNCAEAFIAEVKELEDRLQDSNAMNATRWREIYNTKSPEKECEKLNEIYRKHLSYLDHVFLGNENGFILRVINEGDDVDYLYFSDSYGKIAFPEDSPVTKGGTWINAEDGSIFDPAAPLTQNTSVYKK